MNYYVYLLLANTKDSNISYVGYTNNLDKRLKKHNNSTGAKFTKGRKWSLIFQKKFPTKEIAMKEEYKLKKNYKLRRYLKNKYLQKNENINFTTL